MGEIIDFPYPVVSIDPVRIEIDGGQITKGEDAGRMWFWVDAVESDGCHCGMWCGYSVSEARAEAMELARDCGGLPIHDKTRGAQ